MCIYIYRVSIFTETYRITSLYNTHNHIYIYISYMNIICINVCICDTFTHVYTCLHLFTHPACLAFQEVLDLLLHGVGPEEPPPPVICPIFWCRDHELIHDIQTYIYMYINIHIYIYIYVYRYVHTYIYYRYVYIYIL